MRRSLIAAAGPAALAAAPDTDSTPKFGCGDARFVAICPRRRRYGARIGQVAEAPMKRFSTPLHWDAAAGMRVR